MLEMSFRTIGLAEKIIDLIIKDSEIKMSEMAEKLEDICTEGIKD